MFRDFQIAYARDKIKMRAIRKLEFHRQGVATVLSRSARYIPHAAGNIEFDITPVVEYGTQVINDIKNAGKDRDPDELTRKAIHKNLSAFFLKTIAHVMHHVPIMNGLFEWTPIRNGGRFYECEDICPAFTVHTKRGVMAPIIRNPHQKTVIEVANEMRDLVRRARRTDMNELYRRCAWEYLRYALKELDVSGFTAGWLWAKSMLWPEPMDEEARNTPEEDKLHPKDVVGATCTVANIGMSIDGWQTVTAIPPPQVLMWGIGATRLVPRVVNGQILPRHTVMIAITIDHRAMDGGHVFEFQEHMERYFNNPALIFEWKPGDPI